MTNDSFEVSSDLKVKQNHSRTTNPTKTSEINIHLYAN